MVDFPSDRDMANERYGAAIRVMHHGCEQALLGAAEAVLPPFPNKDEALGALGVAQGYAYALEVMTRRAAPDHLRAAVRRLVDADEWPDAVSAETLEASMTRLAKSPHAEWEKRHPGADAQ